jgi:hypothetical protein
MISGGWTPVPGKPLWGVAIPRRSRGRISRVMARHSRKLFPALLSAALIAPVLAKSLGAQGLARARPCRGERITAITYSQRPPAFGGRLVEADRLWQEVTGLPHTTTKSELVQAYLPVKIGDICTEFARHEAERVIRGQPYIADAVVRPIREADGTVRLEIDTIDELPLILFGSLGHGTLASLGVGNANFGGGGLAASVFVERGFDYRNGYGFDAVQYGFLGQPWNLALRARQSPTGEAWGVEFGNPLLTDLQRQSFHTGFTSTTDYYGLLRPTGDAIGLFVRRSAYDAGMVWRLGTPGRVIGLLGGLLMGEDSRIDRDNFVVLSDSGIVPTAPIPALLAGVAPFTVTRLAMVGGFRALTYKTVRNFDALRAQQDVATGSQLIVLAGPSLRASTGADDYFVNGDLYLASGGPGSFAELRIVGETRMQQVNRDLKGIVGSATAAWYTKPSPTRTRILNLELSGIRQLTYPMQLTFTDLEGGLRGFANSHEAGSARLVFRAEERQLLTWLQPKGDLAIAAFTDVGRMWAGSAPLSRMSDVKASVGLSLLGSYPSGGMRVYRLDVGVPLNNRGGSSWEVRLSANDITHWILREPRDVSRARSASVPRNVLNFAPR